MPIQGTLFLNRRRAYEESKIRQGDPYENLANAIIIQAAERLCSSSEEIRKNPNE
jgi:hypothetical protein